MDLTRQHLRRCLAWLSAGVLALALGGCATEAQVKQIVADSNATLLASQLPDPQPGAPGEGLVAKDPAGQIEEFIAQHPDQQALHGALRVRQAIIFLSRQEYNQAETAFAEAGKLGVFTDRDKALVAVHKEVIWWYENSADLMPNPADAARVRKALIQQAKEVQRSPDIRDFLAEGSAEVGFKEVVAINTSRADQKLALEQTVDDYVFILDPADLEWLCELPAAMGDTVSPTMRRRLRAKELLRMGAELAAQIQVGDAKPTFAKPEVQDLVLPLSNAPPPCDLVSERPE